MWIWISSRNEESPFIALVGVARGFLSDLFFCYFLWAGFFLAHNDSIPQKRSFAVNTDWEIDYSAERLMISVSLLSSGALLVELKGL